MTANTPAHQHALSWFEKAVLAAILANTIVLVWGLIDHRHEQLLAWFEYGFLLFFVVELGVRLRAVGWRPHHFLARPWNAFDTAVIALAFLPMLPVGITLLRVARLARVVHTLRHAIHLRLADLLRRLGRGWLWLWIVGGVVVIVAVVFLAVGLTTMVGTHSASYNRGYNDVVTAQQKSAQFLQDGVASGTVLGTCNALETMSSLASGNPANIDEYMGGCQDGMAHLGYRDR